MSPTALVTGLLLLLVAAVNALDVTLQQNPPNAAGPMNPYYPSLAVEWSRIRDIFVKAPFMPAPPPTMDLKKTVIQRLNNDTVELLLDLARSTYDNSDHPSVIIRVGGNAATRTYWKGTPPLPNQDNPIEPYDLVMLDAMANATMCKFVLVVGMPSPAPSNSTYNMLNAIKKYMTPRNLLAIGIGNEPDHHAKHFWRPTSYTPQQYFAEYHVYVDAVRSVLGDVSLMGPSYAYPWREGGYQIPFIRDEAENVKYMSFHKYALRGCSNSKSLNMLLDDPMPETYQFVSDISAVTKETGTINMWSEGGSASCGGVDGVSNVFASGLWTVDALFEFAYRGVEISCMSGAPQAFYAPFTINNGTMDVRPTYYGLVAMAMSLGGENAVVYKPQATGTALRLKAWATWNTKTNKHHVVVVHKDANRADETVTVKVPTGSEPIKAQRVVMTAPSITALNGFTIAGITLGPKGVQSDYKEDLIQADGNGVLTFTAPKGSVTIVRIQYGGETKPLLDLTVNPVELVRNRQNGNVSAGFGVKLSTSVLVLVVLFGMLI